MKPLKQEEEILKILNRVKEIRPKYEVPDLYQINFMDSRRFSGRVSRSRDNREVTSMTLGLGANDGDFSADNEYFVDTVLHELVHWNGIFNHRPAFWDEFKKLQEDYKNGTVLE